MSVNLIGKLLNWTRTELFKLTFWNEDRFFFHPWGLWQQQKKLQNISFILQGSKIGTEIKRSFKQDISHNFAARKEIQVMLCWWLARRESQKICIVRQNCKYKVYAHFLSGATSHEEEGERFKAMFSVQFPRARLHKLCHQIDGLIFFLSKSIHCLVVCTLPLALNTAHHMLKVIGETSFFSSTTHQFFLWSFYRSNFFILLARNKTQCSEVYAV